MNEIESNRNLGCAVVSAREKKVTWRARDGIARADNVAVLRHFSFLLSVSPPQCRRKRKETKKTEERICFD